MNYFADFEFIAFIWRNVKLPGYISEILVVLIFREWHRFVLCNRFGFLSVTSGSALEVLEPFETGMNRETPVLCKRWQGFMEKTLLKCVEEVMWNFVEDWS